MPGCLYHCKGEINWKAAAQNDSIDDLVARWQGIIFQSQEPLAKNLFLKASE